MNSELFTLLWMWLTPAIFLVLLLIQCFKTGYLCSNDCDRDAGRWWLPNILLGIMIFVCVFWQAEVNHAGWTSEWLAYAVFEYFFSWACAAVALLLVDRSYGAKQLHLNQCFIFNMDLNSIGFDKYVVHLRKNNFSREANYNLVLYRSVRQIDVTGQYVVLEEVYTFKEMPRHEYTKEVITNLLKDYFDNDKIFKLEGEAALVDVVQQKPEVIVIR